MRGWNVAPSHPDLIAACTGWTIYQLLQEQASAGWVILAHVCWHLARSLPATQLVSAGQVKACVRAQQLKGGILHELLSVCLVACCCVASSSMARSWARQRRTAGMVHDQ
jgi:hypothetical protein